MTFVMAEKETGLELFDVLKTVVLGSEVTPGAVVQSTTNEVIVNEDKTVWIEQPYTENKEGLGLSGKYAKAIERGAFKKAKQDAKAARPYRDRVQSPRATSPLYDHSWLSGKYAKAIERGAFKKSKFEIKIANEVNAPTVDAVLIQLSIEHLIVVVLLYPASAHIPRPLLCHEAHFSVNCSPRIHM